MTTICYKTKNPVVYNRGTKYESSCDTFLAYFTYKTREQAEAEVAAINHNKPQLSWSGEKIDWDAIDFFFVDEQEMMEG